MVVKPATITIIIKLHKTKLHSHYAYYDLVLKPYDVWSLPIHASHWRHVEVFSLESLGPCEQPLASAGEVAMVAVPAAEIQWSNMGTS